MAKSTINHHFSGTLRITKICVFQSSLRRAIAAFCIAAGIDLGRRISTDPKGTAANSGFGGLQHCTMITYGKSIEKPWKIPSYIYSSSPLGFPIASVS